MAKEIIGRDEPIKVIPESRAIRAWLLTDTAMFSRGDVYEFARPDGAPHVGLHPSERAIDALDHAVGTSLCRVAAWGAVHRLDDQLFAEFVRVEWCADATAGFDAFVRSEQPDLFGPVVSPLRRARMAVRMKLSAPVARQEKATEARRARKHEMDGRLTEILTGLKPGGVQ